MRTGVRTRGLPAQEHVRIRRVPPTKGAPWSFGAQSFIGFSCAGVMDRIDRTASLVLDFNGQRLSPPRGQSSNSLITRLLFLAGLTGTRSHSISVNSQV